LACVCLRLDFAEVLVYSDPMIFAYEVKLIPYWKLSFSGLQASMFGAFLDVLLDNATRGILWSLALPYGMGSLPLILEMSVLVVTHQVKGLPR